MNSGHRRPARIVILSMILPALVIGGSPVAARAATIHCPAGEVAAKVNGTWRCLPAPRSTMSGALKELAGTLSDPASLGILGATAADRKLARAHRSTLRSFFSNVLLRAAAIQPPMLSQPKKVVSISFSGGKFDGYPVKAQETLRPPSAGESGSPRATTMAIAFHGGLPSFTPAVARAREWVKLSDNVSVRADQCPSRNGEVFVDVTVVGILTMSINNDVRAMPISLEGGVEAFVDDFANPTEPLDSTWVVNFPKSTGLTLREDGTLRNIDSGWAGSGFSVQATLDGHLLPFSEAISVVDEAKPLPDQALEAMVKAFKQSEAYWKSGKCLDASFSPSAPVLKPNQQQPITVTVRRRDNDLAVRGATLTSDLTPAGTWGPPKAITNDSGKAQFTVTAPNEPQTLNFHIEGVSRQGAVKGNLPICMEPAAPAAGRQATTAGSGPVCQPPQTFFQVESITWTENASGSEDSPLCDLLGVADQASGTSAFGGSYTGPQSPVPSTNTLDTSQAIYTGEIRADGTKFTWSNYTTHNCSIDPNTGNEVPCDNTIPDTNATESFDVALTGGQGNPNVQVFWPLAGANIGAVDDKCSVFFWNDLSFQDQTTSVPLTTFQTLGEHTLTFTGTHHFTDDELGNPASIDYSWSYSITFQVVDHIGNPL